MPQGWKPIKPQGRSLRFSPQRPAEGDKQQHTVQAWRSCCRCPRSDLSLHLPSHIFLPNESFWSLISLMPGTGRWPLTFPHPTQQLAVPCLWAPPAAWPTLQGQGSHQQQRGQLGAHEPAQLPSYFIISELSISTGVVFNSAVCTLYLSPLEGAAGLTPGAQTPNSKTSFSAFVF